jgi:glycerophosphoryl diester phosphodiesterase
MSHQQPLPSLRFPPVGFAHRGASAHAPENTLDAFVLALRLGATGLESDVWLTADGVPVLDHDGVVKVGLRKKPIGEVVRSQLPSHIPSLADLFERCGTGFDLSLDLKDPHVARCAAAVVDLAREVDGDWLPRLWLCHWDWEQVVALRPLDPAVKLVDSTRLRRIKEGPERRAAMLAAHGVDALNLHHSDWSGGLTTLVHRFGRFALAWDLQHDHALRTLLRMGIDGVFSDHVDRMVEAMRAERLL